MFGNVNKPSPVNIPLEKLTDIKCKNPDCLHPDHFNNVFKLKYVPALLSPSGAAGVVSIPVYVCACCHTELEQPK